MSLFYDVNHVTLISYSCIVEPQFIPSPHHFSQHCSDRNNCPFYFNQKESRTLEEGSDLILIRLQNCLYTVFFFAADLAVALCKYNVKTFPIIQRIHIFLCESVAVTVI